MAENNQREMKKEPRRAALKVKGRQHGVVATTQEGPKWVMREERQGLRKLFHAVSQAASDHHVSSRSREMLTKIPANLQEEEAKEVKKKQKVWGTPIPYRSTFTGRDLASVMPDDLSPAKRRRRKPMTKRDFNRTSRKKMEREGGIVTIRALVASLHAPPERDPARDAAAERLASRIRAKGYSEGHWLGDKGGASKKRKGRRAQTAGPAQVGAGGGTLPKPVRGSGAPHAATSNFADAQRAHEAQEVARERLVSKYRPSSSTLGERVLPQVHRGSDPRSRALAEVQAGGPDLLMTSPRRSSPRRRKPKGIAPARPDTSHTSLGASYKFFDVAHGSNEKVDWAPTGAHSKGMPVRTSHAFDPNDKYGRSEKPNVQYPDWLESRFTEDPKEVERREYQDGVAAEMAARRRARVAWLRSQSEPSVVPSKAAAVDTEHLKRGGPGMISGTLVVTHQYLLEANLLAKRFGLVLSSGSDGPVYEIRVMIRPHDYEKFVNELDSKTNGEFEFVTSTGADESSDESSSSSEEDVGTDEDDNEVKKRKGKAKEVMFWGQTEQQWQGEEGDVNVNDVVDTLGQKKARHAAEELQDTLNQEMMHLCEEGDLRRVKELVDKGRKTVANFTVKADPMYIRKGDDMSPLLVAAEGGHCFLVRYLLAKGCSKSHKNLMGYTSLMLAKIAQAEASQAVMAGKYGAARRREQATKAVNMLEDRTIFTCAQDGDVRRVRHLVLNKKVKANQANQYGMTPLHFAVANQDIPMVEFLAKNGADPRRRNNLRQSPTDLCRAIEDDDVSEEIMALLSNASILKKAEREALRKLKEEERIQRERKVAGTLRQYTRGTTAAVDVFKDMENPAAYYRKADGAGFRAVKMATMDSREIAAKLRHDGTHSALNLPAEVSNSKNRHARRMFGLRGAATVLQNPSVTAHHKPPKPGTTSFEQWVRMRFGDIENSEEARRKGKLKPEPKLGSFMDTNRTKKALIGALKKCLVEYYYPRPKQILKYMLNARDHDNDRLFHSHADVRDVWNAEKNKLISGVRLLRQQQGERVVLAFSRGLPDDATADCKQSTLIEWYNVRGYGRTFRKPTYFKDVCVLAYVEKEERDDITTQPKYHAAVTTAQEAYAMQVMQMYVDGREPKGTETDAIMATYDTLLQQATDRRMLENREDKAKHAREDERARRIAEAKEADRGGFGPKAQEAFDEMGARIGKLEDTLQQLLYEVKSSSRARRFLHAAKQVKA